MPRDDAVWLDQEVQLLTKGFLGVFQRWAPGRVVAKGRQVPVLHVLASPDATPDSASERRVCGAYVRAQAVSELELVLYQFRRSVSERIRVRARDSESARTIVHAALHCVLDVAPALPVGKSLGAGNSRRIVAVDAGGNLSATSHNGSHSADTADYSRGINRYENAPAPAKARPPESTVERSQAPEISNDGRQSSSDTSTTQTSKRMDLDLRAPRSAQAQPSRSPSRRLSATESENSFASAERHHSGLALLRSNTKRLSTTSDSSSEVGVHSFSDVSKFMFQIDGLFHGAPLTPSLEPRINALKSVLAVLVEQIQAGRADGGLASAFRVLRSVCRELLGCDRTSLFLLMREDVTDEQYLWTILDSGQELRIPGNAGVAGDCAMKQTPINVPDAYLDSRFNSEIDKKTGYKTTGILCAPVMKTYTHSMEGVHASKDDVRECMGVLQVINKLGDGGRAFNENDLKVLEAFAMLSSVVISAAQTITSTARTYERAEMLNGVSEGVSSSLDAEVIAQRATSIISRYVRNSVVRIMLFKDSELCLIGDPAMEVRLPFSLHQLQAEHGEGLREHARKSLTLTEMCMCIGEVIHLHDSRMAPDMVGVAEELVEVASASAFADGADPLYSCVGIPLRRAGAESNSTPIGALCMYAYAELIGTEEVDALVAVSAVIGSAVENAIFFENQKRQNSANQFYSAFEKAMNAAKKDATSSVDMERPKVAGDDADMTSTTTPYDSTASFDTTQLSADGTFELPENPVPVPADIADLSFSALDYTPLELVSIVCHLFVQHGLVAAARIQPDVLYRFVYSTMIAYKDTPFHNFHHAVTVFHIASLVAKSIREAQNSGSDDDPKIYMLDDLDVLALLVAALCHDMGHTGHTNAFHVNSMSELATTYSDQSVLEYHHSALTRQLLLDKKTNILKSLTPEDFRIARSMISLAILGTDMSNHGRNLTRFESKISSTKDAETGKVTHTHTIVHTSSADRELVVIILLHASDLSNPTRGEKLARAWAIRLADEMKEQVRLEKEKELPYLPFMEGGFTIGGEVFFINSYVLELWEAVSKVFPCLKFLEDNVRGLLAEYRQELSASSES